ncbi:MAG: GNAT family N-acetyltransferase [bacterium]|nr:GNAT family N-acetyltransferase [bacterium]
MRRSVPEDFSALLDLFKEVAAEGRWIGTEPGFDRARYRTNWERWFHDPRFLMLSALDRERLVGNLSVYPDPSLGFEFGMLVAPTHRRRGIGRALIEHACAWAREREIAALYLHVFPHNLAALALYRALGFVEVERHVAAMVRANGEAWDVLRMRKELR